ncbi:MAG: type I glyceraldehyde-3-phosphate dehydrogenase [Pseudodesulfovibrio sp.]
MATKIGLNGFGRIGRYMTRLLAGDKDLELVAVNARASNEDLAHLLKYDSVHGRFPDVEPTADGFLLKGKSVKVTRNAPGEWTWGDLGCDIVVESTGKFTDRESCDKHLACGAKKVIVSAPAKGPDNTVVVGVNDNTLTRDQKVISNASCTTNCLAPVAKIINDTFGIRHGIMTTVHSYTMSQRILDGSHKDLRRARACAVNMVPTTTGAAKAVGLVIPELNGVLDGMAIRVPTPNVSLVDLVCELKKPTTVEEVNAALKAAANESMGYTEEPLVSVDFMGSTFGGVVDAGLTRVMGGTQLKVIIWYDNEAGFTNQLVRLTRKVAGLL